MPDREPTIQTMKASQARQQWSQVLNKVLRKEARILVEKSGVPVAAIVSAEDLQWLQQYEAQRAERWKVVDEIRARNRDKNPEQVEQDIASEIAAMRQEAREHRSAQPTP